MPDLTIVAGDVPTAAQFNSYLTHTGSTWNSWTPIVTQGATPTLSVSSATYHRTGRLITFQASVVITSNGTAANNVGISLPVTAAAAYAGLPLSIGWGMIQDATASDYAGPLLSASSTTVATIGAGTTYGTNGRLGATTFTAALANNDVIKVWGSYEAAAG